MVQVTKKVTLIHGFKGIEEGLTKEVTFRDATAGDLVVMDGKGDHEGMIHFAAALTNLTPGMVKSMHLADYGLVIAKVKDFLSVLKPKEG